MPRCRTIPITIPSILEEVLMAWRRYWNTNPQPPRGGHHFPFCIFQPSFARFYERSYRPWERLTYSRSSRSRPRSCNAYQHTRTKYCTEEEKEVWIRNARTNQMTCVERTKEVHKNYDQSWTAKTGVNARASYPHGVASDLLTSQPRKADQAGLDRTMDNLPPLNSHTRSVPPTPQTSLPQAPASVTTIRTKQSSQATRRELSCKGSMILVPTATGAYSVRSPLPDISTRVLVNINPRECVIQVILDEKAVPNSLKAFCDLQTELIRLSYERVVVVDRLKSLAPMLGNQRKLSQQMNKPGVRYADEDDEDRRLEEVDDEVDEEIGDDDCEYEVTTCVEHSFHFPSEFYMFRATKVKQLEHTVYIHVPRLIPR